MTPARASRRWEIGCLLLVLAVPASLFVGWWALLALPAALWLARHERPSGPN